MIVLQKSSGFRKRTRRKLRQPASYRPTITKFLREFKKDQTVVISPEPSSHKGMPFPKFKGRMGRIVEKRGKSYVVEIKDGNKTKRLISRPEHLKTV